MAMALFGMGILVGPIVGPLLGGYITSNFSWRWIFYINIPIGLLSILLSTLFIDDPSYMKRQRMKIDYPGFFFLAVGLVALQYVLDTGQRKDWFASPYVSGFAIISVICLIFMVLNELFTEEPIINLELFKKRSFTSGSVVIFFVMFNLFGSLILLPIFLQTLMGYTSLQAVLSWKGVHSLSPDVGIYRQLLFQARMLGFNDAFFLVALMLLSSLTLVLLIERPTPDAGRD